MKIIDNFLLDDDFKKIQEIFMSSNFPYYFNSTVADKTDTDNFYFTHTIYDKNVVNSDYYETLEPLLTKLDTMFLRRVKVNCYTRSEKIGKAASEIAKLNFVRFFINSQQRLATKTPNKKKGFVVDGRDIGSVLS